jgi:hypothetical protein
MTVRRESRFMSDEIAARTAWALERRGYCERRWAGGTDGVVYATTKGRAVSNEYDGIICDDCGEPGCEGECTLHGFGQ